MTKEMDFFIYLLESYAQNKNLHTGDVLRTLNQKGLTQFVFDMYEMYHTEMIENAFTDLDSLIETGSPAW